MPSIHIVEPTAEFITPKYWNDWEQNSLKLMEECGRVSHKSEGRTTEHSAVPFLERIAITLGHESIIENAGFTVCFIGSRSMSHQLVRSRLGSYVQESQRYCDYSNDKRAPEETLKVIMPPTIMGSRSLWGCRIEDTLTEEPHHYLHLPDGSKRLLWEGIKEQTQFEVISEQSLMNGYDWCLDQLHAYKAYLRARKNGVPAEDARSYLTNACKTEVYTTFNYRMWRHVLGHPICGRALNNHAQWEIRMIMKKVLDMFLETMPSLFQDLGKNITLNQKELVAFHLLTVSDSSPKEVYDFVGLSKLQTKVFEEKAAKAQQLIDPIINPQTVPEKPESDSGLVDNGEGI